MASEPADKAGAAALEQQQQRHGSSNSPSTDATSLTPTTSDKAAATSSTTSPGTNTAETTPVMASSSKLGEQLQRAAAAAAAAAAAGGSSNPVAGSAAAPRRPSSAAMQGAPSGPRGLAIPSASAPRQGAPGSKDIAVSWASLEDVAHIAKLLVRWARERELHAVLDWQQIRTTAERIAGDVTLSTTCEEAGLKPEIGQDLAKLALYDIILVPHRSLAKEAEPAAALSALARSFIRSTSRLLSGSSEGAAQSKGSVYLPSPAFDASSLSSLQPLQNGDVDAAIQVVADADDAAGGASLADRFTKVVRAASAADTSKPVLAVLLLGPGAILPQEEAEKISKALKEVVADRTSKGSALLVSPACLGADPASQPSISSLVSAASDACSPAATLQIGTSPGAVARNVSALLKSLRAMPARAEGERFAKERAALEEESSRDLAEIIAEEARKQGLRIAGASQDGLDGEQGEPGSALASTKLSTKKKEALGRVPCKFFRNSSNGCSAGNACPFAHTMPGEGQGKQICEWFVKGNCRFGHKCALAHILPGQPMSMDRKNKRAAQHGLPLPAAPTGPAQQGGTKAPRGDRQQQGQQQPQTSQLSASQNREYHMRLLGLSGGPQQQRPSQGASAYAAQQRDLDFPFGLPDDLQPPGPAPHSGSGAANFDAMQYDPSIVYAAGLNGSAGRHQHQQQQAALGSEFATSIGSPPASRAFGTSPFSHPGGHALFFSGSQENGAGQHFGGRSAAMDMGKGAVSSGDEHGDLNEEDFLPSSLSDLLTPAELKRRARNGAAPPVAQSMPADRGPSASTLWELHQRNSRAQQALAEEMLALERLAAQAKLGTSADGRDSSMAGLGQPDLDRLRQQLGRASPADLGGLRSGGGGIRAGLGGARGQGSGLQGSGAIGSGPFASSFGDKSAALHEAGQSLPQGLAAGLSRLHLAPGAGSGRGNGGAGHANGSGVGSLGGTAIGSSSNSRRISGQWGQDGLDDHLGPTAPSSIFSNRANPLSLAMARSIGGAGSGFPSSIDQLHHQGSAAAGYSLSPHANRRSFGYGSPIGEGISIPGGASGSIGSVLGGASSGAGGVASSPGGMSMGMGKHLGVHRVRGSGNNASHASPLTLPTTGEEVDEAIFELE